MPSRDLTVAAVGVLVLLASAAYAGAQTPPATGAIRGVVTDEQGKPLAGAMVSAIGGATSFALSDSSGLYELNTLAPGRYLVRAHRSGFAGSRGRYLEVQAGRDVSASIALRPVDPHPVLAAGVGLVGAGPEPEPTATRAATPDAPAGGDTAAEPGRTADETETAWRIRHARRGVLKQATLPHDLFADDGIDPMLPVELLARAVESPARIATSFFADTPFSGQVNLLTTSSFDSPRELFSGHEAARGTAFVRLGAPVGDSGDWSIRGAISQADISAWLLAGSYQTRAPARHRYEIGMSYSTQRYDGGNPLALRDVADGSRNAGAVYGFDTFTISPELTVSYGARYAQYDYLESRTLVSPRASITVSPADSFRISATVSRAAHAPGAEEFLPPGDSGIWLPPQRTFSSIEPGRFLEAERSLHLDAAVERDLGGGSTIGARAFRQRVDDQLVTLFGADLPSRPAAKIGHYLVGNAGDLVAEGYGAYLHTIVAGRVRSSIEYSVARADLTPADDLRYLILLAPAAARAGRERVHDLTTALEADVPETSTKVLVLYRMSNGFARAAASVSEAAPAGPGFDSRFDVQVRQSLPFLDFTTAKWEMLVAVRNFFREATPGQPIYAELLSIRPPKRIVGGVTVHF